MHMHDNVRSIHPEVGTLSTDRLTGLHGGRGREGGRERERKRERIDMPCNTRGLPNSQYRSCRPCGERERGGNAP